LIVRVVDLPHFINGSVRGFDARHVSLDIDLVVGLLEGARRRGNT
jgi:hypothetical protein